MPADELLFLQSSFDSLAIKFSGKAHADINSKLIVLYQKLQAGLIPDSLQSALLVLSHAISEGNLALAIKEVTALGKTHWDLHKDWIVCLKRLLAAK